MFESGEEVEFDYLVALSPQVGNPLGLPHNEGGFIRVDHETLQVVGHPDIYALGDANDFPLNQGFLAMLQANAAVRHLCHEILGGEDPELLTPLTMCIMHQGKGATFAQTPLRETGDPAAPLAIDENRLDEYLVSTGVHWIVCKHVLGLAIPLAFRFGLPFHGSWVWGFIFGPCMAIANFLVKLSSRRAS